MERDNDDGQQKGAQGRVLRVGGGVRRHTIRRQLYIYLSLIVAGAYLIAESGLEVRHLISEGAAFIMVGMVGLIMSTTTTDIGQSLMLAVREEGKTTRIVNRKLVRHMGKVLVRAVGEEGRQTRAANRKHVRHMGKVLVRAVGEEGRQTRAAIEEIGKRAEERDIRMEKRLDRMSAAVEAMSSDVKAMSSDVKAMSSDNREFFRQMLEAQNRILEKVS